MRRTILILGFALLALSCAGFLLLRTPSTHAKSWGFTNADVWGSYAAQWSGTMLFPTGHPLAMLNGPYASVARVWFDGQGNVKGTSYENYSGLLLTVPFQGTYQVNEDGTAKMSATFTLFGQPATLEFLVILGDEGKQARILHVGPTASDPRIPGMPNVGTVLSGSAIRQ